MQSYFNVIQAEKVRRDGSRVGISLYVFPRISVDISDCWVIQTRLGFYRLNLITCRAEPVRYDRKPDGRRLTLENVTLVRR